MNKGFDKKRFFVRLICVLIVLAIAVVMFIIGRGHTVYFDNKEIEYNGKTYETEYSVEVFVDGEKAAKLKDGDRGMATTMGQNFSMELLIKKSKEDQGTRVKAALPLPYNMDGIIINLPALLAGLPADAYMSEFIPVPSEEELQDEEVITDEMEGLMDFGESGEE